jgi:hypothetical protein
LSNHKLMPLINRYLRVVAHVHFGVLGHRAAVWIGQRHLALPTGRHRVPQPLRASLALAQRLALLPQYFRRRLLNRSCIRVSRVQFTQVVCNFGINILQYLVQLGFGNIPTLVVDRLELTAVNSH